jgi:hypothetical protein
MEERILELFTHRLRESNVAECIPSDMGCPPITSETSSEKLTYNGCRTVLLKQKVGV